ncbi:MAG TPA: hypothetical protein VK989_13305 [Polyangia bacterium]|nr:hypothetical protein [Polyangia bacterium]
MASDPRPGYLWQRAVDRRARGYLRGTNRSAKARMVLADLLRRCGYDVGLVAIHAWTRARQGEAYLWAIAFLSGREDLPPPIFLRRKSWRDDP